MSRRAFANVQRSFTEEAARVFRFLTSEFGLTGPELQGVATPAIAFVGPGLRYRIILDSDEKAVTTRVEINLDSVRLDAELDKLVFAAGLGARNLVAQSAHTLSSLLHALNLKAKFVRLLQPLMTSTAAIDLMRRANAREWHLR